jgi:hypothetical protein
LDIESSILGALECDGLGIDGVVCSVRSDELHPDDAVHSAACFRVSDLDDDSMGVPFDVEDGPFGSDGPDAPSDRPPQSIGIDPPRGLDHGAHVAIACAASGCVRP